MAQSHPSTAVLVLAHGTPNALPEMAEYLARVTGGRALPPEVVAELQHRYAQIGLGEQPGPEPPPLTRWTLAQARLLEAALTDAHTPLQVFAAMRNWHPFIDDVVGEIRAAGITRLIAICLAPQNSRTSIGLYRRALTSALESDPAAPPIALTFVESWSEQPALIDAFSHRLAAATNPVAPLMTVPSSWVGSSPTKPGAPPSPVSSVRVGSTATELTTPILFTAHSVPCRTISTGEASIAGARPGTPMQSTPDPYPVEAKRTAALVFDSVFPADAPNAPQWYFAFQSQGVSGGPWIGPTVEYTLRALAAEGHSAVIVQPVGFLCDHVEILYDIDIAFTETAHSLGLRLYRADSLNDSPLLTQALVDVVQAALNSQPATGNSQLSA